MVFFGRLYAGSTFPFANGTPVCEAREIRSPRIPKCEPVLFKRGVVERVGPKSLQEQQDIARLRDDETGSGRGISDHGITSGDPLGIRFLYSPRRVAPSQDDRVWLRGHSLSRHPKKKRTQSLPDKPFQSPCAFVAWLIVPVFAIEWSRARGSGTGSMKTVSSLTGPRSGGAYRLLLFINLLAAGLMMDSRVARNDLAIYRGCAL